MVPHERRTTSHTSPNHIWLGLSSHDYQSRLRSQAVARASLRAGRVNLASHLGASTSPEEQADLRVGPGFFLLVSLCLLSLQRAGP